MKEKIKVSVRRSDIKNGEQFEPASCPIALALKRTDLGECTVHQFAINSANHGIIKLPSEASDFVEKFDYGFKVKPFSFEIEVKVS